MLLNEVKNHLRITWNDEDAEITKLIERGKEVLSGLIGVEEGIAANFETEGLLKALLLDWCRYSRNNALESFEQNFSSELLRAKLVYAVEVEEYEA